MTEIKSAKRLFGGSLALATLSGTAVLYFFMQWPLARNGEISAISWLFWAISAVILAIAAVVFLVVALLRSKSASRSANEA